MIATKVRASDDYDVPLSYFEASTQPARAHVLLLPALGIEARFYQRLAEALSARGVDVAVVEQRGHGRSAIRPSRSVDFGWREMIFVDASAALDWLADKSGATVSVVMGHSLGGHHAAILCGQRPEAIDGLVLAATGTAWTGAYTGRTAASIHVLRRVIGPLGLLLGHYPGATLGFGGREARTVMSDWASLAGDNRYVARGIDTDIDAAIAHFPGATLALRMSEDAFAPEAAVEAVLGKLGEGAAITRVTLDAQAIGKRADHFSWAKHPDAAAERISAWCERLTSSESSES
ncbi:MAG: alpha/beta fold hydrolase [Proteobacteria bacterium]|nr:alpha/beta fold hydrolase [Pseudomonadota bacterium]